MADVSGSGNCAGDLRSYLSKRNKTTRLLGRRNEEMSDTIDEKLSIVLWVTSSALILSYFLIAASYANGFETFKTETSGALFLAGIIGFLIIMIESVIFQQKCVDTTKKMNPEKRRPSMIRSFKRNGWRAAMKPKNL